MMRTGIAKARVSLRKGGTIDAAPPIKTRTTQWPGAEGVLPWDLDYLNYS
jgi:hypothetical protein